MPSIGLGLGLSWPLAQISRTSASRSRVPHQLLHQQPAQLRHPVRDQLSACELCVLLTLAASQAAFLTAAML